MKKKQKKPRLKYIPHFSLSLEALGSNTDMTQTHIFPKHMNAGGIVAYMVTIFCTSMNMVWVTFVTKSLETLGI